MGKVALPPEEKRCHLRERKEQGERGVDEHFLLPPSPRGQRIGGTRSAKRRRIEENKKYRKKAPSATQPNSDDERASIEQQG